MQSFVVRRSYMPPIVLAAIYAALGAVLGSIITFLGLRYTARTAAQTQVLVSQNTSDRAEIASLRDDWRELQGEVRTAANLAIEADRRRIECEKRLDVIEAELLALKTKRHI
jgi:hypothetical protein